MADAAVGLAAHVLDFGADDCAGDCLRRPSMAPRLFSIMAAWSPYKPCGPARGWFKWQRTRRCRPPPAFSVSTRPCGLLSEAGHAQLLAGAIRLACRPVAAVGSTLELGSAGREYCVWDVDRVLGLGCVLYRVQLPASSVMGLAQPAVSTAFRPTLAGRALSGYDRVIFSGIFACIGPSAWQSMLLLQPVWTRWPAFRPPWVRFCVVGSLHMPTSSANPV